MIIKGRSPTMRHVSQTHRVALDWLFDRFNLDPKIQIKIHRHQEPTCRNLDKGNSRDEWNHLLTSFNISHFRSTVCTASMAKRERVTAKSRPMMNLTARTPSFVSTSASSNPGRTSYGYQDRERSVLDDRTEQLVENSWDSLQKVDPHREEPLLGRNAHSAMYEETIHDRTGQFVSENL